VLPAAEQVAVGNIQVTPVIPPRRKRAHRRTEKAEIEKPAEEPAVEAEGSEG
jgi:hypothetical protein